MPAKKILIVEDSPALRLAYAEYLSADAYAVQLAETGSQALDIIRSELPHVVLLDLGLPDMNGLEILRTISAEALPVAVVVVTAEGSMSVVVEAMRLGAYDFVAKPFPADRLRVTVRNALEWRRLDDIVCTFQEELALPSYEGFVGHSLAMQTVYRLIDAAANSLAPVLITGESGTGKELCAEALHRRSARKDKPLVALNCAAIPKELIESEIFGHVKGAFTGAISDREGAAGQARGGTLFLDEICEMDFNLQSKLLRLIQTGKFQRVGDNRLEKADVRFVAATNRDPLAEVAAGRFREDLFYRLNVIPIALPPLRERDSDIVELAEYFLQRFAKEEGKKFRCFSAAAKEHLLGYPWPGNVRELENVVRGMVVLHDGGEEVQSEMLPPTVRGEVTHKSSPGRIAASKVTHHDQGETARTLRPLWLQEKEIIEEAISECDGNIPRAAAMLEISASTIYRKKQIWQARERA